MTIKFNNVFIEEVSTVSGPLVKDGPLKENIDYVYNDYYDNEDTFEKCEIKELTRTINIILEKSKLKIKDIDFCISSDLINQLTISNLTLKNIDIPNIGVYSACASACEELIISSNFISSKKSKRILNVVSTSTLTVERQFRNPVEYGMPKNKNNSLTITSSCAILTSNKKSNIKITSGTIGKIVDLGIKDPNNMGIIMAPSCAETIYNHLNDLKIKSDYYDLILTGDLGEIGLEIMKEYIYEKYNITFKNIKDSSTMIYDKKIQDEIQGGSGPSCIMFVLNTNVIPMMKEKKLKRVLLVSTGCLLSTTMINQGFSIPSISHAISLEAIE